MMNPEKVLVDLGSHSLKIYKSSAETITLLDTITWNILESYDPLQPEKSKRFLTDTILRITEKWGPFLAIGTEVFRRHRDLASQTLSIFQKHGSRFEVLSQEKEAELIAVKFQKDLPGYLSANPTIMNVGGGSIQIVQPRLKTVKLFDFGIIDINKKFNLNEDPSRFADCVQYLETELKITSDSLIYTGGEYSYLKQFEIDLLESGWCEATAFLKVILFCNTSRLSDLEKKSPFDPKWMWGCNFPV